MIINKRTSEPTCVLTPKALSGMYRKTRLLFPGNNLQPFFY